MTEEHIFRSVTRTGIQKLRKIKAETFELAKEKAIELYSHIKYFKQTMDLQTALARAAKASLSGRPYYIIVDEEEGECSVNTAPIGTATHKFVKGVEDKTFASKKYSPVKELADEVIEEIPQEKIKKSKQKEIMSTKAAVKKSNKVVKKLTSSKVASAKRVLTPASKETKIPRGNNMFLTQAEWNKVDAILKKDGKTFSGWSRELVQSKIK